MQKLHQLALESRSRAYCPYSNLRPWSQRQVLHWVQRRKSSLQSMRRTDSHSQNGWRRLQADKGSLRGDLTDRRSADRSLWILQAVHSRVLTQWCNLPFTQKEVKIHLGSVSKGYEATYTLAYLFPVSFGPVSLGKPLPWSWFMYNHPYQ